MNKKKCRIYDFSKGREIDFQDSSYQYKNGQLDLDLEIEVLSPEPVYCSNILKLKKLKTMKEKDFSGGLKEKSFNIA